MAYLRKSTSEGNVGLLYSILQKCIRRGLEGEALYYSKIIYEEASINCLRKRLIYVTNEDIGHIELSEEIRICKDEELFKYCGICCRLKKTHEPAWLSRLALHYCMKNIVTEDDEIIEAKKCTMMKKNENYKGIREYLGKYSKLYQYSGKNNLVWCSYILFKIRPELNQKYSLDEIVLMEPKKFDEVPFWVYDKHVPGGQKGYNFFFEHSLVVNEHLYKKEKYAEETKNIYLEDEKCLGNGKTNFMVKKWLQNNFEKNIPGFKDVIQIQLLTRKNNPNVYFATSVKDNKKYVLKGPLTYEMRKRINKTETLKKNLELNHLNVEFINLFEQNWMKCDSLLDYDKSLKELKTSKLEENVYIYTGETNNIDFEMIKDNFMEIFEVYLFRLVVGANDHCARNIIYNENQFYSIDDHFMDEKVVSLNNLKMKRNLKELWDKKIMENKEDIYSILLKWYKNPKTSKYWKRMCQVNSLLKNLDR